MRNPRTFAASVSVYLPLRCHVQVATLTKEAGWTTPPSRGTGRSEQGLRAKVSQMATVMILFTVAVADTWIMDHASDHVQHRRCLSQLVAI